MTEKRKNPNLSEKLAAALLMIFDIPREHAKAMSTEQILSLVQFDHDPVHFSIARDLGWTPDQYNHPSNLTARLLMDHAEKTNKRDKPAIAKSKRLTHAQEEFRRRMLTLKLNGEMDEQIVKNAMNKDWPKGQKIKSKGFNKTQKRPLRSGRKFQTKGTTT